MLILVVQLITVFTKVHFQNKPTQAMNNGNAVSLAVVYYSSTIGSKLYSYAATLYYTVYVCVWLPLPALLDPI